MSQKAEKPTLSGQRIKTRKRDEKEKYDPSAFRDSILLGLTETGNDLEAIYKYLDVAGGKLDYRRYGEVLFDILIAGGQLAPGGQIIQDGDPTKVCRTNVCIFSAPEKMEYVRGYAQMITKLLRRFKYLEKVLDEEMKKVLVYLKGFDAAEKKKLAWLTAIFLSNGQIPANVLLSLFQDYLVKDGTALEFIVDVFTTWIKEKDMNNVSTVLRKSGIENRLMEFFPLNKRTPEIFEKTFREHGLGQIVEFQQGQVNAGVRRGLQKQLTQMIKDDEPVKDTIAIIKDHMMKYDFPEHETIVLIWNVLMGGMEWNKKDELVAEQALKYLKQHTALFVAFSGQSKSELSLMNRVQEFCFENMNFMKVFQKIIVLFYKADVLGEEMILKWYKEGHSSKGKSIFLEQMKSFVEWLKNAEEESESGEDDQD